MTKEHEIKFAFFGSSQFSVFCLEELKNLGLLPNLVITTPDMPTGRGLKLTATPVKAWAMGNGIECLSPAKLDPDFTSQLTAYSLQLFLVASYGKIIPKIVLDLPKNGVLNIHPSLLPKYRGASPLQEQILNDEQNVGVTLMQVDEKMDHGPIVVEQKITIPNWPVNFKELEEITAETGTKMFADKVESWINNKIKPVEQNHSEATFTKKINKEDGLLDILSDNPYKNWLKIQAFNVWPQTYFFVEKNNKKIRVIIKDAEFKDNILTIKKVLPEGKKEMDYQDFLRGLK